MFVSDVEILMMHHQRAAELRAEAAEYRLARSNRGDRRRRWLRRTRRGPEYASARAALP